MMLFGCYIFVNFLKIFFYIKIIILVIINLKVIDLILKSDVRYFCDLCKLW